jgi:DNA-binding transcriptional regulator YiaG
MSNLAAVLKDEIRRLAKKEAKEQVAGLRSASAQYRRDIAALKRANKALSAKVAHLEAALHKGKTAARNADNGHQVRFAPQWVASHRHKLGVSQADYGTLVGVSAMTIYNWEKGKSRPQERQLAAWGAVKTMGKREALRQLDAME